MPKIQIRSIQVLRAFAASAVVLVHAQKRMSIGWPDISPFLTEDLVRFGNAGVDVFFVLSGFLMAYLHRDMFGQARAPQTFFMRRLIRIAPIYWLLSGFALLLAAFLPQFFASQRQIEWPWLLGNFLFAPIPQSNGSTEHLLIVGWTLDFEMFFYTLFAIAMLWRRGLAILCATLIGAVVLGRIIEPTHPVAQLVTDYMLLEFLGGIGVALLITRVRAPHWAGWLLLALGILWIATVRHWVGNRIIHSGVPAVAIVLGTLWLGFSCSGVIGRMLVRVGDASYSIYLTQVFTLPAVAIAMKLAGVRFQGDAMILVLLITACALGVAFWWMIERPITELLKKLIRRKPVPQPVPLPA